MGGRVSFIILACCALPGIASADPEKQKRADQLFVEGRQLLNNKQPAEACEKFKEAIALDPVAAGTMLNLGLCNEELEKYHSALVWYRRAQTRASETNLPDHESAAKEHASKLASLVPAIALDFTPPVKGAHVKVDGDKVEDKDFAHIELDPGHHIIEVRAPGKKTANVDFEVEARKTSKAATDKLVQISMVDGEADVIVDPGKKRRRIAYGLGAAGIATLAFTLTYCIVERLDYNSAKDSGDIGAANNDVHHLRTVGTTTFFVGAALVGAAAYLYFTAPEKPVAEQTAWAPIVGPDQLGFAVSGSF
jgi:tetratricopeptide (TPR) repeat protein